MMAMLIDPDLAGVLVPAIVFATLLCVVVAISISVAFVVVRKREMERDVVLRRMAHDLRMKELEIEALRLRQGAGQYLAEN